MKHLMGSEEAALLYMFEQSLAREHLEQGFLELPGWCIVCKTLTRFRTDLTNIHEDEQGALHVNWRESQICATCGLSFRLRNLFLRLEEETGARRGHPTRIYLTEDRTPMARICVERFPDLVTSEFLGFDLAPGTVVDGTRHEDLQALSFPDASFDVIASADVLEHVPDPVAAIREMARVSRGGARLVLSLPFFHSDETSRQRARLREDGTVEHLLPPEYHHDPLVPDGVLVFQDIGWDLLEHMREAGYVNAHALLCHDMLRGFLGAGQLTLEATRGSRTP